MESFLILGALGGVRGGAKDNGIEWHSGYALNGIRMATQSNDCLMAGA